MLSSVTVALAILTVSADGAGPPAAFRLSDYVRKTPATATQTARESGPATRQAGRSPVRLAQAPKLATPTQARTQRTSFTEPVSMGPAVNGPVMEGPIVDGHVVNGSFGPYESGYPYGGDVVYEGSGDFGGPCTDCGPVYPHHHAHVGYWSFRGLPSPWCSRGDMPHHIPYLAQPKNYYYFRPYQWFHIPEQQAEVTSYGGDPRHPYANREFQEIYQELESIPHAPLEVEASE